ncbi:MAG TPA: type II secretion system F family protein [Stenomitos sp.]
MPSFRYRVVDLESQQPLEGSIEATNERSARAALRSRGLLPMWVQVDDPSEAAPPYLKRLVEVMTFRPVKTSDLAIFIQQFSALLDAGLPIVEVMVILEEQTAHPTLRRAVAEIRKDLLGGLMLSEAIGRHARIFPPLLVSLTEAGELSGALPIMLNRLSEMLEKNLEIERKVKGAMTYPAVVLVTVLAVLAVMFVFVVPTFQGLYSQNGAALPLPTQMLLSLSSFIRTSVWWLVACAGLLVAGYHWFRRTPVGRPIIDRLWLRLPLVGPVLMVQAANTFTRAFGTVYGSGVSIVPAIATCRKVVTNRAIAEVLEAAEQEVELGNPFASRLRESRYFPRILTQMISVGESSGKLEEMAERAVRFSDKDIDYKIKQMTNMLEPALTVVIGLIVMAIALALYLPLFDLSKIMSSH